MIRKILHFFGMHQYILIFTAGVNRYWECCICGKRKFDSIDFGYTEPDYEWLWKTGEHAPNDFNQMKVPEDIYIPNINNN